tara:strand:- start:19110 stop:19328 length:219 start_codon:yes stop_codon:yes gene_type:complete
LIRKNISALFLKKNCFSFLETNAHLGVSIYRAKSSNFMTEFFLQARAGKDLLNGVNGAFYPLIEIGVTFHLF